MLKIGDFSKLARVTIKALRYYDELGLLKPVKVDEFTGYRYYAASQMMQLYRIIALKDMGLSLEEIARLLKDDISISHILDLLYTKQADIKQRLEEESTRLTRVEEWLKQIEKEGKMPDYEIVIKKVKSQKVLAIRKTMPNYGASGQLFGIIGPYVFQAGARVAGPPMLIEHDREFKEKDVDIEVAFPIVADVPVKGEFKCYELAGYNQVATSVHKGSYDTISAAYSALMRWIEANGYQIIDCSREIYFTAPGSNTPPSEYVTEVQFPVAKL
jgi:effector-binding domain-containing protein